VQRYALPTKCNDMLYEAGQGPAFLFAYSVVLGPLSQKAVIDPLLPGRVLR
jgi:hypothetical protein